MCNKNRRFISLNPGRRSRLKAFTLIELLIVVAIIAILAAIAVPNFLEAQVRAKISRVKSDFRSLSVGIESYRVDNNVYPWYDDDEPVSTNAFNPLSFRAWVITTPVAYISSVDIRDPFISVNVEGGYSDGVPRNQYNFRNYKYFKGLNWSTWVLNSIGPDRTKNKGLNIELYVRGLTNSTVVYDSTNGSKSAGDIPWTGGDTHYANK